MSRKNHSDEYGYYAPKKRKKNSPRDIITMVAGIVISVVLILLMVFNAPIINFKKVDGNTITTQQVSIMKYWKLWQPLVEKEGTLTKVDSNDSALNLKSDLDSNLNDGLDLEQTIEGQYTILFLGMDESGELSDVDWILQFDLIAGSMNILQIPRDSYMPDYASYSTTKFNSIYHSGQETGVTPIQRVVRFRHGYAEGDIGRVKAQRIFLAAAMEKMLNMSQTELMSAMQKIYKNQWIATDLSLEQISMVADFASQRLTMDNVNVFMVPGEGATYYPGDGSAQSVYSIHKSATIDLLNGHFRPYQNEIYPEESAIVELVPEGEYLARDYDDTQENLNDISKGDSNDGAQ